MTLTLLGVSKTFGKTKALDEVAFETKPGEIVAVLGLNGAGKSTLLRAMNGLLKLDSGQLLYGSEPYRRENLEARREVMFVPDAPVLHPSFSILRNVGIYLQQYHRTEIEGIAETVAQLFEDFDLLEKANHSPLPLSRGELYKAGLISLIAVNPSIWLLDEPFASGMDAWGISRFRSHAEKAAKAGASVIYTTQLVELACDFSDRIVVLEKGESIVFESPEALKNSEDPRLAKLLAAP